jgi:hypothetical protein
MSKSLIGTRDYRPLIRQSETCTTAKSQFCIDGIRRFMEHWLAQNNVCARIYASPRFSGTKWVRLDCWIPCSDGRSFERCMLRIDCEQFAHHDYEILLACTVSTGDWEKAYRGIIWIPDFELSAMMTDLLLTSRRRMKWRFRQTRRWGLDFWRPVNELTIDWLYKQFAGALPLLVSLAVLPVVYRTRLFGHNFVQAAIA